MKKSASRKSAKNDRKICKLLPCVMSVDVPRGTCKDQEVSLCRSSIGQCETWRGGGCMHTCKALLAVSPADYQASLVSALIS